MTGWYSTKSKLTWKLKGTKSSRMYFQLLPSTHRTDVTEFGLLPTLKAWDGDGGGARPVVNGKTTFSSLGVKDLCHAGLLPTPMAQDGKNSTLPPSQAGRSTIVGLLCTPTAQASRGNTSDARGKGNLTDQIAEMNISETGKTSQLNPRFVAEMMGYPPNYTELPFLNGEPSPLKHTETQ
jgi:hypothetical protein